MSYTLHEGDLPDGLEIKDSIAVDTETMGLRPERDRLCLVQLSTGDGHAHLVRFKGTEYEAPNLKAVLQDEKITKILHFARFDLAVFQKYFGIYCEPVYCTKIASKLCRTFTDRHGLKSLVQDLLGTEISKEKQSSDWGAEELSDEQLHYAANDVLYLHQLKDRLEEMLIREGRQHLAYNCFKMLNTRAEMDLLGWYQTDIFAHSG